MSRNPSNDKRDKKDNRVKSKNIFESIGSSGAVGAVGEGGAGGAGGAVGSGGENYKNEGEEFDQNQLVRKRSERQASQGVKLLVNRERGINSDVNMSIDTTTVIITGTADKHENKDNTQTQEGRKMPLNYIPNNNNSISQNVNSGQVHNSSIHNSSIHNSSIHNSNIQAQSHAHGQSNPQHHSATHISKSQIFSKHSKDDKIINRTHFEKILIEKLRKEGLEVKNINEITSTVSNGLESYLKNVLEKLISTSRIRNVNLNLYSKQSERNPVFKIHTHNLDRQASNTNNIGNNSNIDIGLTPYKDFSILFTRNMKNTINVLEQYEELNLKKLRQERVSLYKSKLEEISALKEKEKEEKGRDEKLITTKQSQIKPRVKKRDSMLKNVRNTLAKSQKRDDMARHKKETMNTLETFLENKPKMVPSSLSSHRFESEMASAKAESHNYETFTKLSEVSKSEAPGTIGTGLEGSNDINLNVFKYFTPSQNIKISHSSNIRRRITLKDLIHFLEGERKTPLQNLILHKAIIKLNQFSH